jgi:hypothetical protein
VGTLCFCSDHLGWFGDSDKNTRILLEVLLASVNPGRQISVRRLLLSSFDHSSFCISK